MELMVSNSEFGIISLFIIPNYVSFFSLFIYIFLALWNCYNLFSVICFIFLRALGVHDLLIWSHISLIKQIMVKLFKNAPWTQNGSYDQLLLVHYCFCCCCCCCLYYFIFIITFYREWMLTYMYLGWKSIIMRKIWHLSTLRWTLSLNPFFESILDLQG